MSGKSIYQNQVNIEVNQRGVWLYNHWGDHIYIDGCLYTDVYFNFTLVARAVGKQLGITHLFDTQHLQGLS